MQKKMVNDKTSARLRHTTLRELNKIKYDAGMRNIDDTIQLLIGKYQLKEATKK